MRTIKKVLYSCLLIGLAISFFAASHANAAGVWIQTYNYKKLNGTTLASEIVTQDGIDQAYLIEERDNNVRFTTPATNVGGNTREFFWPANAVDGMDQLSCAVWSKQTGEGAITQQGAVLRMHKAENGGTRGITVMKNIWYGATWIFNVHVWDTSSAQPYTGVAQFDMSEATGKMWYDENGVFNSNLKPFPWHFCARTIGDKLQFKVWTNELEKQPSWQDPKYVREMLIPEGWNQPGKAGWYIGHLKPGHTAIFQNLQISHKGL